MKGFTFGRHLELTLFPLSVTPEVCNPESSRSISESSKTGVTFIELLVVVLIIGILSSVALPQYRKAVLKARATEGITLLRAIDRAEDVYFMANGEYTLDWEALDLELPKFNCSSQMSYCQFYSAGNDFVWEITFGSTTNYTLYCSAETTNVPAIQICASFGSYSHTNGSRSYYRIVEKKAGKSL